MYIVTPFCPGIRHFETFAYERLKGSGLKTNKNCVHKDPVPTFVPKNKVEPALRVRILHDYLKKGYDHVISACPAACTVLGKRCLRNCPPTARKIGFTQIYSVQIWCKKVQTRRKSKAKMVNTAFACKFTWGSKFESKCGIYHLCPLFNLSLHFFAPNLHWVNLAWVLAQNGVVFPPWVPDM